MILPIIYCLLLITYVIMNRIILFTILFLIGFSNCKPKESAIQQTEQVSQQVTQQVVEIQQVSEKHEKKEDREDLSFLLEMDGKYPYETNLFANEPMKTRLTTIMGGKYQSFLERMEVQIPIQVKGNEIFMSGFMKHSGGEEEAALVIDVSKNLIWVLTFKNGQDMSIFKDDRDVRMPDIFILKIQELTN